MALTVRSAQSVGGPGNASAWHCLDDGILVVAQGTLGTTPVLTPGTIVPQGSSLQTGGLPAPDVLPSGTPIARLEGAQVCNIAATLSAQTALALGLAVYRAGVIVGGTIAFGWLATGTISPTIAGATVVLGGGSGTPSLAQLSTVAMPKIGANTAFNASGDFNLLPGDIPVVIAVAQTGTIAVGLLAVSAREI